MRILLFILLIMVSLLWLGSCTKDASVAPVVYKDTTINNNKIPPYKGVTLIQLQTYVNRLFIDLDGRIPVPSEMDADVKLLQLNPFSDSIRQMIIRGLINNPQYYKRFFQLTSARILNATDSATIARQIQGFNILINNYLKTGDQLSADQIKIENQKLIDLLNSYTDYQNGNINISGFMFRMLNNSFYDQINMGTFNFLKAAFEDLLHRTPTAAEQTNATKMINGAGSNLFLVNGSTKADFIRIMTTSDAFYEGLVVQFFSQYLARNPDSKELTEYTLLIKPKQDLMPLLLNLLKSKEYAGF